MFKWDTFDPKRTLKALVGRFVRTVVKDNRGEVIDGTPLPEGLSGEKKLVCSMQYLSRLVLLYIYNKKSMKKSDIGMMQRSIVAWANKADISSIEAERLDRIGWILKENADGKLELRKELFKRHKINFMKFHRMPEFGPYANTN